MLYTLTPMRAEAGLSEASDGHASSDIMEQFDTQNGAIDAVGKR